MSNDTNGGATERKTPVTAGEGVTALALLFGDSVKSLVQTAEAQQTAILAMTAMLALSPGVADIDAKRLGVVVQALTMGRKDADRVRGDVAAYVSLIVGFAKKLPEIMADAEKAEADAKAKGKKGKPN